MENRITNKVNAYINELKTDTLSRVEQVINGEQSNEIKKNILKNYLLDYKPFVLTKQDLQKRKRTKNTVPVYDRCSAKRANGEQCTRRKKDGDQYCGTHTKGTPHGILNDSESAPTTKKVDVQAIDIKGIIYYLDNNNNVYDTEDIVSNKKNPRVIAKYVKTGNEYSIPELFNK